MRLHVRHRGDAARHRGQRQERRGRAARRHVPGHQRRRADRHRPDRRSSTSTASSGALVTVCLTRVPDPLEFGITIIDDDGRVQRFLEKPTWGQVFSDTVNTGIYVMEPEVLDYVADGRVGRLVRRRLPRAARRRARPSIGYVADGYWEDVGTHESYLRGAGRRPARAGRRRHRRLRGLARGVGRRGRRGRPRTPCCAGPLYIGDYAKVEARRRAARVHRPRQQRRRARAAPSCTARSCTTTSSSARRPNLRGCVIGKNTDVMRAARVEEGAVVGDECVVEEEAIVSAGREGLPVQDHRGRRGRHTRASSGSRAASAACSGRAACPGIVNVEITPELVVRLASAYATTLRKGSDRRHVARRLAGRPRVQARGHRGAHVERHQRARPRGRRRRRSPASRRPRRRRRGGVMLRTTPGDPESVDIVFLDDGAAPTSPRPPSASSSGSSAGRSSAARSPARSATCTFPPRAVESYVAGPAAPDRHVGRARRPSSRS